MKSLSYLKDYKVQSILAPLFKLLEASFELLVPLVVADIIDNGINSGDKAYIFHRCLLLVLLAVVGLISAVSAQFFAAKSATGATTKLRSALFKKIQSLSFSQLDSIGSATLITRMTSDVNQIQTGINMFLRLLLRSPFIVFGATIMAFYVDVKGALVFAVVVPVLAIIVAVIMSLTIPRFKGVQNKLDSVLLRTKENVKGVRVIRAFTREDKEIAEFVSKKITNELKYNLIKDGYDDIKNTIIDNYSDYLEILSKIEESHVLLELIVKNLFSFFRDIVFVIRYYQLCEVSILVKVEKIVCYLT